MAVESEFFIALVNQIDPFISQNFFRMNPFVSLVEQKEFDTTQGLTPTAVTHTAALPEAYPFALAGVNIDNGPGPSGDVVPVDVDTGQIQRTYSLETDAWQSNEVNQDDMTFRQDAKGAVRNIISSLMHFTVVKNSDWMRVKNIEMIDTKVSIDSAGSFVQAENQDSDFEGLVVERENTATGGTATTILLDAGANGADDFYNGLTICIIGGTGEFAAKSQAVTIDDYTGASKTVTVAAWPNGTPDNTSVFRLFNANIATDKLDWDITLPCLYDELARRGGDNFSMGMAGGMSVYSLSLSPEEKRKLFKTDKTEEIKFGVPLENFTARGITEAVDGYAPNVDLFPIRYDACLRPIYPTTNTAATTGQKFVRNVNYASIAKGGAAVYEVATIMAREIYEVRPRPMNPATLDRASFNAQNYTAELTWINAQTYKGANDRKNKGYWLANWQKAAKPVRPENGFTVLTKI